MTDRNVCFTAALMVALWGMTAAVAWAGGNSNGIATGNAPSQDSVKQKIVVTAKSNQAIEDTAGAISIITAEDIRKSGAATVKDVLIEDAGINMGVNGSSAYGRQNISVWGTSSEYTLILVDGKKVSGSDAQVGHSDFQYNWVPINAIERIEVIKGPMSSVYGSQAIGGVVNIITKETEKKIWGDIDLKYGNSSDDGGDLGRMQLTVGGRITDRVKLMATGEKIDMDPARQETDATDTKIEGKKVNNGMAKVTFDMDETQSLTASLSQGQETRWKVDDAIYFDIDRQSYSAGYKKDFGRFTLDLDAYLVDSDFHYNTKKSYTHSMTDSTGKAEVAISALDYNYIVTGLEYKKQAYEKTYDKAAYSGKNFDGDIANTAGYVQDEIEIGENLLVTVGSRYDNHERFGGEFSPKVNALYKIGEHHRIKAGYGEGFKAPTVTQNSSAYSSTAMSKTYYGNDDLKPEKSKTFQVGYEFYSDIVQAKATLFKTEISDLISYTNISSSARQYVNVDKANIQGLELETLIDFNRFVRLKLGYQYLDTEDESTGQDLSYRPEHSFKARLLSHLPYGFDITVGATYTGEQVDGGTEYDAFTTYKFQVSKQLLRGLTLRAGMDNITDEDLDDKPYEIAGRLAYVGLNYTF